MVHVDRSYPAPESLAIEAQKKNGKYNKEDVTRRLKKDFHDKCYICEIKGLQDPEVEHLLPYKNGKYPERKFDWDNLFWCCGHCNRIKNVRSYDTGIIDCCKEDPEQLLICILEEGDIRVEAVEPEHKGSVLTATLLYEVFNQKNTGIREAACEHRMTLLMEKMNVLYRNIENYKKNPTSVKYKRMMEVLLKKDTEFAAFKRCFVRENLKDFPELQCFLN